MEEYVVDVALERLGLEPLAFTVTISGTNELNAFLYTLRLGYMHIRNFQLRYIVLKWCGSDGYKEIERYCWED